METSMSTHQPRRRSGFTIIEMVVSMVLMLAVLGMSTQLLRRQSAALSAQAGRIDAQQIGHFSLVALERELRMAGAGVVDPQPVLVQAAPLAITFNADLMSQIPNDPSAVYYTPDADSAAFGVFLKSAKKAMPTTTWQYPDSTYMKAAGVEAGAETISFWLSKDSTSLATNEYLLFRRVNAMPASLVAGAVIVNPGDTIFQFFKGDTTGSITPIPTASLPLTHSKPLHGSLSDTGSYALIDSVRMVRVRLKTVYHDPRQGDVFRRMDMTIRLMNAGMTRKITCGENPVAVTPSVAATAANVGAGIPTPFTTITWTKSLDEGAGEKDVERYAIFRRLQAQAAFAEPFASVPAGQATYSFQDTDVATSQIWIYGIAAQDCTPSNSSIGSTSAITIP